MKTAQAIIIVLVMLALPVSVHAATADIVTGVWDFPSRSASEIASWIWGGPIAPTQPAKVLGVRDLTTAPIIEEAVSRPDLGSKLDSTGSNLEKLYLDYQLVLSETVLMGLNWNSLTVSDVTAAVDKQNSLLSDTGQVLDSLSKAWGWSQSDAIKTQINSAQVDLATVRSVVTTSGMQQVAYDQLKLTIKQIESIVALVGDKADAKPKNSLYAKYSEVRQIASEWDELLALLDAMLTSGDYTSLAKLETRISAANQIPHMAALLSKDGKNRALGLVAVVEANKMLLAQDRGQAVSSTWLEETPDKNFAFKTLVINPSVLARQEIDVKYFLPAEIQLGDVVNHDSSLEVSLDSVKDQVLVQGHIIVAANDSRIVKLETKDIWELDQAALEAQRLQAITLVDSMAGLPSFVQAVALKSKIDTNMQKILAQQVSVVTPEQKIRAYRQIAVLQQDINNSLTSLQQLAQTDNSSPWQELTAWKEVALMVGGLVFVVMGVGLLTNPATNFGGVRKKKAKLEHINIFTTRSIASSDL